MLKKLTFYTTMVCHLLFVQACATRGTVSLDEYEPETDLKHYRVMSATTNTGEIIMFDDREGSVTFYDSTLIGIMENGETRVVNLSEIKSLECIEEHPVRTKILVVSGIVILFLGVVALGFLGFTPVSSGAMS